MTEQLDTWRGDFGQAYTDRNQIDWRSRLPGFREILTGLELPRVVEVGCNRGHNLMALSELLGEASEVVGIEPNRYARELARQTNEKYGVLEGNGSELPFRDSYADLVFTAGVLIHVPPAVLPDVMREIVRVSRRYVLALEYFSEQPEEVPYRGLTEHLWKRNFFADYQAVAPALKLVRTGYFGPEQGFDRTTWWLLKSDRALSALKSVAIIQARLGSTRLPGKVLLPLAGRPMLAHVIERVSRASRVDEVLVATTTNPGDAPLVEFCRGIGCAVFRGDEQDVLDRYYQAARASEATVIVRITSDCPLIDPEIIDEVLGALAESGADYASNIAPERTFPRGLDTEAFLFAALERCWREASEPGSREHVTAHIYRHPEHFRLASVTREPDESEHRWTVDTAEDYALAERIYTHFGDNRFGWQEALATVEAHPEWSGLNAHVEQKAH